MKGSADVPLGEGDEEASGVEVGLGLGATSASRLAFRGASITMPTRLSEVIEA